MSVIFTPFNYVSQDGIIVQAYSWIPPAPQAIVQISHGMMEHARRYDAFARFLAEHGYAVYANDHRGHGSTAKGPSLLGHLSDRHGWNKSVYTMNELSRISKEAHPGLPVVLFGHSMGSALARSYALMHGDHLHGLILSGLMQLPAGSLFFGTMLAKLLKFARSGTAKSKILVALGYGSYKKYFKPALTGFEWLSSSQDEVERYVEDPLCGFPCSNSFYIDFFSGMNWNNKMERSGMLPGELPVLIIAGQDDPVGNFGRGPEMVRRNLLKYGLSQVRLITYHGGRHEMLNERQRDQVFFDILSWLGQTLAPVKH